MLPPVLDVREAMRDDAPILHESLRTTSPAGKGEKPTNVAAHNQFKGGDVDKGFAEADVVVEREFTTKMVHQGYIEPQASTAMWNPDGQLTIWTSTQGSFAVREQVTSEMLQPPRLQGQGGPDGDRRRLRRQDPDLPGAGGGAALEEDRPPGEDGDDPRRGLRGHRPDLRHLHQGEAGREEGRHAHRRVRPTWPTRPAPSPARPS